MVIQSSTVHAETPFLYYVSDFGLMAPVLCECDHTTHALYLLVPCRLIP